MELSLAATVREEVGKQKVHKLRQKGLIPAVLYGEGKPSEHITIQDQELNRLLAKNGYGKLISLEIQGGKKTEKEHVLIKDYQRHPVKGNLLHVDFLRVDMNRPVTVKVPVHMINEEKRVNDGAILELVMHELEISCLPANIPDRITVDVSQLTMGNGIHVKDLAVGEGMKILNGAEEAVVLAVAPTVAVEEKHAATATEEAAPEEADNSEVKKEEA